MYPRSSVAQPSAVLGSLSTMIDMEPTAGNLHGARLGVQGVQLQVHGAGERQGDPDTVEHVTVREDPDVDIVDEDVVEVSSLLVPKESVRHPDLLGVGEGEVLHAALVVIKPQPGIIPLLSEGNLHSKLLREQN